MIIKLRLTIIFIITIGKLICTGQTKNYVATCDKGYITYSDKEQEIKKITKNAINYYSFSTETKQELGKIPEETDFGQIETIIYRVLSKPWCDDMYEFSKLILDLDIPKLNQIVILESFKNYYPVNVDKISSFCFFQERIILIDKSKDIDLLKLHDDNEVMNAWKCIYLSQIMEDSILIYIKDFKKSENSFVRFTYAQIMYKFGEHKISQKTLLKITREEIKNLKKKNLETIHYVYVPWSLELLLRVNNQKANRKYKKLKKKYQKVFNYHNSKKDPPQLSNLKRVISVMDEVNKIKECP